MSLIDYLCNGHSMQKVPTILEIQAKVSEAAFGRPLITNVLRGQVVEAIVACALGPAWNWCAEDYSSWDFEHTSGLRLEVKQSAAKQSWAISDKPSVCSFDIAARKGRWEGPTWIDEPGRAAHIYVFAHHPVTTIDADHREPAQWDFYVLRTSELPATRRLSLKSLKSRTHSLKFEDLALAVKQASGLQ